METSDLDNGERVDAFTAAIRYAKTIEIRRELDDFFVAIVPRLARLSRAGRLPDMSLDPSWKLVNAEWIKASKDSKEPCDPKVIRRLMEKAVQGWEAKS